MDAADMKVTIKKKYYFFTFNFTVSLLVSESLKGGRRWKLFEAQKHFNM
jgi:hypothetical protein